MKNNITAIIFGLSIVIAAYLLGNAVMNRNNTNRSISVTGLGKADFTSDLIVWEGSFAKESSDLQQAYRDLEKDKKIISSYLLEKGITKDELVFNAVNSRKNTRSKYTDEGKYIGDEFLGYILTQSLQIDSNNVEKVEKFLEKLLSY